MSLYFLDPSHVVLERWSIREREDTGERHFVGFDTVNNDGRVSTPIRVFDPVTRAGSTATGSTYQLAGRAGHDRDGEYVWSRVVRIWEIKGWKDVTSDLVPDWRQALAVDKLAGDD
jgi:nitric oxide synthase oxygenase domain/subunit